MCFYMNGAIVDRWQCWSNFVLISIFPNSCCSLETLRVSIRVQDDVKTVHTGLESNFRGRTCELYNEWTHILQYVWCLLFMDFKYLSLFTPHYKNTSQAIDYKKRISEDLWVEHCLGKTAGPTLHHHWIIA